MFVLQGSTGVLCTITPNTVFVLPRKIIRILHRRPDTHIHTHTQERCVDGGAMWRVSGGGDGGILVSVLFFVSLSAARRACAVVTRRRPTYGPRPRLV